MNAKLVISLFATLLFFTVRTQAGTVVCSGTIETLHFDAGSAGDGYFYIQLSSMNTTVAFCDPDKGVAPLLETDFCSG